MTTLGVTTINYTLCMSSDTTIGEMGWGGGGGGGLGGSTASIDINTYRSSV